jgi:uncharacterized protein
MKVPMSKSSRVQILSRFLAGMLLVCWTGLASGRDLAVEVETMVEVEIATIGLAAGAASVVLLREPGSQDVVPIFIGPNEAEAILRGLHDIQPPRPMTHELFSSVLEGAEVKLERVYVDDLVDNTFLGMLELRLKGYDEPVRIDSRPSDALALALRTGASILVAPRVLEAARQIDFQGLDDQIVTAIGITVTPLTRELREALELPDEDGVLISGVRGEAEDAGMRPGALLLEINGQTPTSPMAFLDLVRAIPGDENARIRYWQDGNVHEAELSTDVPAPRQRRERETPGIAL